MFMERNEEQSAKWNALYCAVKDAAEGGISREIDAVLRDLVVVEHDAFRRELTREPPTDS